MMSASAEFLEADDDEDQAPDDDRRAEDQDPGLTQCLAEVAEHLEAVHLAHHASAEAHDHDELNASPKGRYEGSKVGRPTFDHR